MFSLLRLSPRLPASSIAVKYRSEISAVMQMFGTCLTFPTDGLYECMLRVVVYLGRTRHMGTTYSASAADANELVCYADSNWDTRRSITGYVIILGGASISASSHRQHCISMSSCEAELVTLASCAIELIYIKSLLECIGHSIDKPVRVCTDNKGAYDLCHRFTSASNSRHIDRKIFKMRELRGAGVVLVDKVPTEDNPADIYTKILSRQPFEKHRKRVLNLPGDTAVEQARRKRAMAKEGRG